jgi:septal ring-binding cell division protein DamX
MRQGQLPQAARGFQANVKAAPAGTLSVQLLVACAPETVQKAVDGVRSDELFILPVNYQGRDCFRMCWGLYASPERASAALRALPDYFRVGGASPRVQPVAGLLP